MTSRDTRVSDTLLSKYHCVCHNKQSSIFEPRREAQRAIQQLHTTEPECLEDGNVGKTEIPENSMTCMQKRFGRSGVFFFSTPMSDRQEDVSFLEEEHDSVDGSRKLVGSFLVASNGYVQETTMPHG